MIIICHGDYEVQGNERRRKPGMMLYVYNILFVHILLTRRRNEELSSDPLVPQTAL